MIFISSQNLFDSLLIFFGRLEFHVLLFGLLQQIQLRINFFINAFIYFLNCVLLLVQIFYSLLFFLAPNSGTGSFLQEAKELKWFHMHKYGNTILQN